MLTILTWLWSQPNGATQYQAHHVNIWADMVRRNLSIPHRLACVTDMPGGISSDIEIIPLPREFTEVRIPTWGEERPQCLRRIAMFRRDAAAVFGERFVCMDLDLVVGGSLDPLFDTDAEFKICRGTAPHRPYNGSMMLLTAGARPQVYERFTPSAAAIAGRRFLGSDQAWIGHILPEEQTWGLADGISWNASYRLNESSRRIVFYAGRVKPWMVTNDPWVGRHYRRNPRGRCLLLGYGQTIWDDVATAIEGIAYEAVIASPEAAEHWPAPILAIANNNEEAERLARMHGFDQITWCGKEETEAA